jgi:tRNA-2-methylthio-N6-dimethylallyladenosine synthase
LNEKDADVILIMTCSIRENAEQKIWNRLKDFCVIKKRKPKTQIGILGCMAERLKDKIVNKEKMVDVVFSILKIHLSVHFGKFAQT